MTHTILLLHIALHPSYAHTRTHTHTHTHITHPMHPHLQGESTCLHCAYVCMCVLCILSIDSSLSSSHTPRRLPPRSLHLILPNQAKPRCSSPQRSLSPPAWRPPPPQRRSPRRMVTLATPPRRRLWSAASPRRRRLPLQLHVRWPPHRLITLLLLRLQPTACCPHPVWPPRLPSHG